MTRGKITLATVVVGLVNGFVLASSGFGQAREDLSALNRQVVQLHKSGSYSKAIPIARRAIALAERLHGPDRPELARPLNNLAVLYEALGRHADAEPLYKRSLAISEKALGPNHQEVGRSLSNLAVLYEAQGRFMEAERLFKRSLAISEKALGRDDPAVGLTLNNLAMLYKAQGRYAEAAAVAKRSLAIREKALGPDHTDVGVSLNNLAAIHSAQGRYAEAEPLYRRSLAITEKAVGRENPSVARTLNNLAHLYEKQGRYTEAEGLLGRSLTILQKTLGPSHPSVGRALTNLGGVYQEQGRHAEAGAHFKRSLAIIEKALGPNHPDVAAALDNIAGVFKAQGRYAEAEPFFQRSLAITEKALGPNHPDTGTAINNLGVLYRVQGRYAEAELLLKRSLTIAEKALGPSHPDLGPALNNLAELYRVKGQYGEAEPLFKRNLLITEAALGSSHRDVGTGLNNLADLYHVEGRYAEAEPIYKRSISVLESALGPDHPSIATVLSNLAELYRVQGRYSDGEALHLRSLRVREKALGADHPDVGISLNNLAALYRSQGRYAETELLLKRSLAIAEKTVGSGHSETGIGLNNLAELYQAQGRYAEAEPLLTRSLTVAEKALGPDHPDVATTLNNLGELHRAQGRYGLAEPLLKRSLSITEKALGPDHPGVGLALNNLALVYVRQRRYADAAGLYNRSLSIRERRLGPSHPAVAESLNNIAQLYEWQGRYGEAEALYKRSLPILQDTLGPNHLQLGAALSNFAFLAYKRNEWAEALDYWRRGTGLIQRRAGRGLAGGRSDSDEAQRLSWQFLGVIKATYRLAGQSGNSAMIRGPETFETAQWVLSSEAADSLMQMAARSAKGSPQLAALVRERQDLVNEWHLKDKLIIAAKSEAPAKRKAAAEKALAERLAGIDARLGEIGRQLAQDFADYAALASPAPVSTAEAQSQLGADEALVLFLDTPEWRPLPGESFIWVVTKTDVRWVRSELGTAALTREVAALRCGLDAAAWDGEGAEKCATAVGIPAAKGAPNPVPFDHARAHRLFAALFGQVQDLIEGKHLLIVPSGPLTQLPFQVLVTKAPADGVRPGGSDPRAQHKGGVMGSAPASAGAQGLTPVDHRATAWLAREHAITVLPAVSSLKALRRVGRPSAAPRPMIGVGNPLLDGPDAGSAEPARLARARQRCPETLRPWKVTVTALRPGVARVEARGGLADLARLKALAPLPETTDELCAVAHDVKADVARDIRLGSRATEREVKHLSASGELAQYRMVHFATHGALAGELDGTHEPGLVLTPPDTAGEEDDGYLSASEIAALKLDADWVVLSACNTAAGAASNAEALSGLGRAFIYAGARALLVSHWAVDSDATVKLITGAVREMARDARIGRAEAMRRSMLALIDRGTPEEAHPAYWAPFVVVGEGAAGR